MPPERFSTRRRLRTGPAGDRRIGAIRPGRYATLRLRAAVRVDGHDRTVVRTLRLRG